MFIKIDDHIAKLTIFFCFFFLPTNTAKFKQNADSTSYSKPCVRVCLKSNMSDRQLVRAPGVHDNVNDVSFLSNECDVLAVVDKQGNFSVYYFEVSGSEGDSERLKLVKKNLICNFFW